MDIAELFANIENARLCEGLIGDDAIAVATEPTENPDPNPNTIAGHKVPKAIELEEPHFEVTLSLRSVTCEVLVDNESDKNMCKACTSASNAVNRAARKKGKASATPEKRKASLTACGPERLQVTVKSTRLQVKDLDDRLQELQCKVKEQGMGIRKALGKTFSKSWEDATLHIKFFWQEQMNLLQSAKMGRRYHSQFIRFALSLHGKSPSAIENCETVVLLFSPAKEYFGAIRTISNRRLVLTMRMFKACQQRSHPSLLYIGMQLL